MNKILIKGRISSDIDIRFTQTTNKKIAKFSVAVRRDFKNKQGEYDSDFFNVSAFGNTSEFLEKYFSKGQEIIIIGRLQTRSWETDSGEKRYATDIIAENVEFCGNKKQENVDTTNSNLTVSTDTSTSNFIETSNDDLPF